MPTAIAIKRLKAAAISGPSRRGPTLRLDRPFLLSGGPQRMHQWARASFNQANVCVKKGSAVEFFVVALPVWGGRTGHWSTTAPEAVGVESII
jgi:hypothetical protein